MAVKFVIFTFTKEKSSISIHLQVDNMTALSYLIKMRGTNNKHLLDICKSQSFIQADHNYCRVPTLQIECEGRLVVSQCRERIETFSKLFS